MRLMYFDIDQLTAALSYKLLTATVVPRPIAWVVTADARGTPNAAPFSFFNVFGGHPPAVCLGIGQRGQGDKDTLANIRARGEFVINLVPEQLAQAMTLTSVDFPPGWNELEQAGLAVEPCEKVRLPRIAHSPVALECRLKDAVAVDAGTTGHILVIGQVVAAHILDEAVLDASRCRIDTARLNLIGRMQSPGGYIRTRDTFELRRMDFAEWQATQAAKG